MQPSYAPATGSKAYSDIVAGRIIRNTMFPLYREGKFDEELSQGLSTIIKALSDPAVADELKSKYAIDSRRGTDDDISGSELFNLYLGFAAVIGAGCILVIYSIYSTKLDDVQRYRTLDQYKTLTLFGSFPHAWNRPTGVSDIDNKMKRVRRPIDAITHCGTRMELIDEEHDNDYLTPAQDTEERINSIDYDVWHCPKCHQTEVPYINRTTNYTQCERCGARAMSLVDRRTLRHRPSTPKVKALTYTSVKTAETSITNVSASPETRSGGSSRRWCNPREAHWADRGGGGGGFSGGSFGGGMTGGGGAGGRW